MTQEELADWEAEFASFQARFAHLFQRSEPRKQAGKYLRGLISEVQRKNGWQLAEKIGDKTPDGTERLLYKAEWEADAAQEVLQAYVIEVFGSEVVPLDVVGNLQGLRQGFYDHQKDSVMPSAQF